jgi:outer membrane usher protein
MQTPASVSLRRLTYSALVGSTLAAGLVSFSLAIPSVVRAEQAAIEEAVLEVTLEAGTPGETMVVLRGPGAAVYLDADDFSKLRLLLPDSPPIEHEGRRYYSPAAIRGCRIEIDEARQRLVITAPAAAFETTRLSVAARPRPGLTPASPGAFFNYQVYAQQVEGQSSVGTFDELGLFAGAGVLTSTAVGRSGAGSASLVRLDTTYTQNFPGTLETVSVGDAISDTAAWGDAVRYAGIRWSRNFSLRPDLLTTPLLSASGAATVPSTVDVFVNNQLAATAQTSAGPFVIDRLPAVTGTGDISVVVRDAMGRETVMTQSFYSSNSLLAPGLTAYSLNIGSLRDDYALASDHYGPTLAEASYGRGITDGLTLSGHSEYLEHYAHATGVDLTFAVGTLGVIDLTSVNGGDSSGSGWLTGVSAEHKGRRFSFIASGYWAGSEFAQVGQSPNPAQRVRERSLVQSGVSLGRYGSLSSAYVREAYRDAPTQQTIGLTHSVSIGQNGSLNLSVTRILTAAGAPGEGQPSQNSTSVYLIYVLSLGGRDAASLTGLGGSGAGSPENALLASLSETPPIGPGPGYRLSAATNGDYDADWKQQFAAVDLEAEAARNNSVEGRSATVTGALTLLDGQAHATRQINGSFAVVDVGGLPDIPVYVENQMTAMTDASGRALLYNLRPYEDNHVSVSPSDLPLDTRIESSTENVAPPFRTGVVVHFPIERIRGGTLRLLTSDGQPVPAGATVRLKGKSFPVVLDGVVYVTGLDHGIGGEASWVGGRCVFRVNPPAGDDPLPDLGDVPCTPVR